MAFCPNCGASPLTVHRTPVEIVTYCQSCGDERRVPRTPQDIEDYKERQKKAPDPKDRQRRPGKALHIVK